MSSEHDSDDAERARLDAEAFERLPPAVKLATLLERERKQKKLAANSAHSKNLGVHGALAGAAAFLLAHLLLFQNIIALALIAGVGALAGFLLVVRERSHIAAMVLVAAFAIVGDMLAYSAGLIAAADMTFTFFVWMILELAAVLIVIWAKKQREML